MGEKMPPFSKLRIPRPIYQAMVAHAWDEAPNECVGLLAGTPDGWVVERYPLVNALASPTRFESDAESMFAAEKRRRASGLEFLAVYHSHPGSPPVPSATDLEMNYSPDVVNLIISLQERPAVVRAYWLNGTDYRPADWEVAPAGSGGRTEQLDDEHG